MIVESEDHEAKEMAKMDVLKDLITRMYELMVQQNMHENGETPKVEMTEESAAMPEEEPDDELKSELSNFMKGPTLGRRSGTVTISAIRKK